MYGPSLQNAQIIREGASSENVKNNPALQTVIEQLAVRLDNNRAFIQRIAQAASRLMPMDLNNAKESNDKPRQTGLVSDLYERIYYLDDNNEMLSMIVKHLETIV